MTRHLFISPTGELRSNWSDAFPEARASDAIPATLEADMLWVLLPWEGDVTPLLQSARLAAGDIPVIAISDVPDDAQGIAALKTGISGYCNAYANPLVLQQIVATVQSGGTWIGQSLMQRLMSGAAAAAARRPAPPAPIDWASTLTRREADVARIVALGSSNKEIARLLNISERTVKAHLGAIFEKLNVRDRLQLTLHVNGITKR